MPAGLERDVQELYDYVNELVNTAESKGNECIDKDACWTIVNRLTSRVEKMINKVLTLEEVIEDEDQLDLLYKIFDVLNNDIYVHI